MPTRVQSGGLLWLIPVKLGISFIGGGVFMAVQGIATKKKVRDALLAEHIISGEESSIPGVPVSDAATAEAQAELIRVHSLRETGGKTFADLPRDDPQRNYYLRAVTLRTALGLAVVGFKVSDLVVGMGAFMAAVGGGFIVIGASMRGGRAGGESD